MNVLIKLIRYLTSWAWRHEINVVNGLAKIEKLHVKDGAIDIFIQQNPAQAQYIVKCFANMVASSPNYTEMKFELVEKDKFEWITVLIEKGNGKTPHQLRMEAEKERDELKFKLDSYCALKS